METQLASQVSKSKPFRKHSAEEKRKSRNERKKRRRAKHSKLISKQNIATSNVNGRKIEAEYSPSSSDQCRLRLPAAECESCSAQEKESSSKVCDDANRFKDMASTYWRRWRHELHLRKVEFETQGIQARFCSKMREIAPCELKEPQDLFDESCYIGRGSFAAVKLQLYHGMIVAVKEYFPRTLIIDVKHEAEMLSGLSHPCLPILFGMNTKTEPYHLVTQFYGVCKTSICIAKQLAESLLPISVNNWVTMSFQLIEAIDYLHFSVNIIHNDIKSNNVLITENVLSNSPHAYSVILIDFGNATEVTKGMKYNHPTEKEAVLFSKMNPHLPPEVCSGKNPLSRASDIYSYGKLLQLFTNSMNMSILDDIIAGSACFPCNRLSSKQIITKFKDIL